MHAEDELARHADFDAEVGGLLELFDGLERRQEVGVARRGGRVEVDAVGADLGHALADEDHVFQAQLGGLHLLFARLVDLHHAEQVGRVGVRPVRSVVETHVRHGAVQDREHRGRQQALDGDLVERDHRLGRLERVVDPAEFHGVEREDALEDLDCRFAAYRQVCTTRQLRRDERARRFILGQRHFVAGLDADDSPRRGEDLDELLDLAFFERWDLALVGGVFGRLDDVFTELVGRQLDGLTVTHSGPYLAHCVTPPFREESARSRVGCGRADAPQHDLTPGARAPEDSASWSDRIASAIAMRRASLCVLRASAVWRCGTVDCSALEETPRFANSAHAPVCVRHNVVSPLRTVKVAGTRGAEHVVGELHRSRRAGRRNRGGPTGASRAPALGVVLPDPARSAPARRLRCRGSRPSRPRPRP